ncbi:PAS domain-containing protein [Roseovarius sp. ZX-A-9]|uniref:PAS domain-containing protein n=1 Tax=Roseovarius sp. ZX-A-9 TaxID=3014783 RepID=UPI00232F6777|nr:PAS domain-containing protein [Roseovarius sp. ZX-A-9]
MSEVDEMSDEPRNENPDTIGLRRLAGNIAGAKDAKALKAFVGYWQQLRVNGRVPRRADIDPRGIEPLLSNAFIVERIAPGLARLRVAGVHLSDLLGMEVRGMPISAFFNAGHRDALARHLVQVFDSPATMNLSLRSEGGHGEAALTGTMLLLPLTSDLGDISRALGCLVTNGTALRPPRRFEITGSQIVPLDVTGPAPTAGAVPKAARGFAETKAPFTPKSRSERPYLRLVHSQPDE